MAKLNHGRRRTLDPSFFTDERVMQVEIAARLLFEWLWTKADREGRLEEPHHVQMKVQCFPADSVDVRDLLKQLIDVGLVTRYIASGRWLLSLPGFLKYQRPHKNEVASKLPPPEIGESIRKDDPTDPSEGGEDDPWIESGASGGGEIRRDLRDLRVTGSTRSTGSAPVAEQPLLPGVPEAPKLLPAPRRQSDAEIDYEYFESRRKKRLEELGGFVEDKRPAVPFINAALKKIREACESEDELWDLMQEYFSREYPAKYEPPFPFEAFCSAKVWPKLLAEMREVRS